MVCPGVTFGLLTILLGFWTSVFPCWLDVMYQPRSSLRTAGKSLGYIINAGLLLTSSRRLIFGRPVIALGLTGNSLSVVKWERLNITRMQSVSLVSDFQMFSWTPSPRISGGPILSLLCSTWVGRCLRFLVGVDWSASRFVRLICCQIILTARTPWSLLMVPWVQLAMRYLLSGTVSDAIPPVRYS